MRKSDVLPEKTEMWLVSSCLVGLTTRYDGESKPSGPCLGFLADKRWIPVCPEQLGGLATPRVPAVIKGGDGNAVLVGTAQVITAEGVDVSTAFIHGAKQVLEIIRSQDIAGMCVKARSPSCGLEEILGVTSALLLHEGVQLREF